jgi:hypothetical protein
VRLLPQFMQPVPVVETQIFDGTQNPSRRLHHAHAAPPDRGASIPA